MELVSQKMRKLAPELDPLRIGTGWAAEDLAKPQILIESTFGDSHPGSGHLDKLVEQVQRGIKDEGGRGARYFCQLFIILQYVFEFVFPQQTVVDKNTGQVFPDSFMQQHRCYR